MCSRVLPSSTLEKGWHPFATGCTKCLLALKHRRSQPRGDWLFVRAPGPIPQTITDDTFPVGSQDRIAGLPDSNRCSTVFDRLPKKPTRLLA